MPDTEFEREREGYRRALADDGAVGAAALDFVRSANPHHYSYNFDWLGLPIIQYPADIVAMQELIWRIKPQVIVETGVARGGSLVLSASILEILGGDRKVVGVEVALRDDNRRAIEEHPLAHRINLVDGSSIADQTLAAVERLIDGRGPVLVFLDSNHTHDHVLAELRTYSPFVRKGSFIVVFDTVIEFLPADSLGDRPWSPGNSPKSAVDEFLAQGGCRFIVDEEYEVKLGVSVAPGGYLRCVR